MAKPNPVASTDGASSSTSPPPHPSRHRQGHTPRRRRRKAASAATTAARSLAPSSTLLSLLSIVVASSVAEGSPAPPAFLCPSIEPRATPTPVRRRHKRSTSTASSEVKSSVPRAVVRNIADKYEQGEDGVWRRVESYTLYGVCPVSAPTSTKTATLDTNYDYIPDTLPPGWEPKTEHYGHESRTTLILAMSLVLAFVICILIIACLFWRKSLRRKYRERDLEGKGKGKGRRRNRDVSDEEAREAETEKESKAKQKIWARATARWKENARYTARQRRGKRTSIRSRAARSSISLDNPRDGLTSGRSSPTPSSSLPPSRSQSRRNSTASVQHDPSLSPQEHPVPTISLAPPAHPHSSPPAYRQKALATNDSSEDMYADDNPASTAHLIHLGEPSHASSCSQSNSGDPSSNNIAHVATDDKAVLARLADLASQPVTDEAMAGPAGNHQVSAPEWWDEELEDIIAATQEDESNGQAESSTTGSSPFPPPPSKASLAAPNFYDYPYAFEEMEIIGIEPELGPSAPPFEETPSSGFVVDAPQLAPSAPPMLDEDDLYVEMSPSAPPMPDGDGQLEDGLNDPQASVSSGTTGGSSSDGPPLLEDYTNEGPSLPRYRP
ncbi:hypothetical protein FA13DRAFT_1724547 [Coprinellus micaceus]|uniref:Uncharacterized protein n=1 Tax=Coprinellus micaceus TaxID=71717 RepID=A0A4Y7TXC8_COPMI|nr:hypothetical protein FA13DRAFT_1724547 [Coprinellus micaceus]